MVTPREEPTRREGKRALEMPALRLPNAPSPMLVIVPGAEKKSALASHTP